ncbi:hypothetical protein DL93DRAFT_1478003 [Clavulina sp. PMI_390]|nr:hypothetical protein DL93DRAFT_1478003 [Clavulina sp. PMI_390]
MPQNRTACLQCQRHKVKCNGAKPHCARCTRLKKECGYPAPREKRHWPTVTEALEARILEAEMTIHKLALPSTHNVSVMSERLLEKIGSLGDLSRPRQSLYAADSIGLLATLTSDDRVVWPPGERMVLSNITFIEDPDSVQRLVEQELLLISLFLPYRAHYFFQLDVDHFLSRISLPPSHPNSIHPCLLNACYLGACSSNGGGLTAFKPHFLERTRYFLHQSLMFADRTIHFLWANLILGVYFAQERRVVECVTVAGTTARFALACGLNLPDQSRDEVTSLQPREFILPPPGDKPEMDDRVRLAHSIYVGCQVLPLVCGSCPSFTRHDGWSHLWDKNFPRRQDGTVLMSEEEIWRFDLHLKVSVLKTFERVQKLRRAVTKYGDHGLDDEYMAIETQIRAQNTSFLPLFEKRGPQSLDGPASYNPHTILSNATLYGSGLVLHSLRAGQSVESKRKLLECVQALVDICDNARGNKRLHVGLVNAGHMMNATRIIAKELRRREVKENAGLSIQYCHWIELLLDYLDDTTLLFPAWNDAFVALKDTLVTAAKSLSA